MSDAEAGTGGTVGERLRAAREAAGLTLADVAGRTRVNIRHLAALEAADHTVLPAAPYSVGFVKAYGREVGLDGVALAADFRREMDLPRFTAIEATRHEPIDEGRLPSRLLAWTAAAIALLIVVGYGLWRSGTFGGMTPEQIAATAAQGETTGAAVSAASTPPAAPAPAPTPPAPPATGGPVLLTANQPAWIKVYERDGTTLFQGELAVGQRYEVPATARDPLIRLGRAEALTVSVGGREVAPLGRPARTVKDVSLKADALLARPVATAGEATAAR